MKRIENFVLELVMTIFFVVGIGMMIGASFILFKELEFKEIADEVTATITSIDSYKGNDGERHTRVYVSYTYNGQNYQDVRLGIYSSNMYEGMEIKILCDRENPGHIKSPDETFLAFYIVGGLGLVFFLTGIIYIFIRARKNILKKKLLSSGRQLYAIVDEIGFNGSFTVNGRNPYVIYCSYRDEFKDVIYCFKSNNIWTNPGLVIQPGDTIKVYVDEKDYSKYHVDFESIMDSKIVDYT